MLVTKDIAVVILNWNGKDLLQQFLPSVVTHSGEAIIYVVDNASTDDSVAFLKTNYPNVSIIINSENGGYAKGYNEALSTVKESILCLLNSDIEVTQHWLTPILEEYNTNADTAIIQPKLLDYKHKTKFEYAGAAGGFIDKYGYPFCRGRIFNTIEDDHGQYNDVKPIFWASGACFFIRNSVFEDLNGFDESYFAHMEEIDLCWRAYNINYSAKYVGTSTVYHVGGATLSTANPKKTYLNFRNSLFTLVKNTDSNLVSRTFIRMLLDGVAIFMFLVTLQPKNCWAILKAHLSFYKNLKLLLAKRYLLPKRKNYHATNSIVWSYYLRGKKTF